MFKLTYDISIGGRKVFGVNDVKIDRSLTSLTGTCTIKLPKTAVLKRSDGTRLNVLTADEIKRGDAVEVSLGYDGLNLKEFSGYVNRVNFTDPIEIECEDASYLLKEKTLKKSYKNTDLSAVLTDICEGTGIVFTTGILSLNIERLILATDTGESVTKIDALNKLIDDYCLVGYFDANQQLFVGLRQGKTAQSCKLRIGWNTLKDDELKYHNKEDQKVKITAVYFNSAGKRIEAKIGDDEGEARTIFLSGVTSETDLAKIARQELDKFKFDGYSGSVTAFLQPFCDVGSTIHLTDTQYSERTGSYYCEGIELTFGTGGGRRKIVIGAKITT